MYILYETYAWDVNRIRQVQCKIATVIGLEGIRRVGM